MIIDVPAFHRMEHIHRPIINNIIKDFKRAAIPVKTDKQASVFVLPLALIKSAVYTAVSKAQRISASVTPCLNAAELNSMMRFMI
jgi:hypothetical protein